MNQPVDRDTTMLWTAMRGRRTPEDEAFLRELSLAAWERLADRAGRLRVAGVIAVECGDTIPEPVRTGLQASVRSTVLRNLRFRAEFVSLAKIAGEAGGRLLALKGLPLAHGVYPQAGMRDMVDLDVLVPRSDLDTVLAAAIGLGYSASRHVDRDATLAVAHHLPRLLKPHVALEIHWRLAPETERPHVAPSKLWARAVPSPLAPGTFELAPEDALLHICTHAGHSHLFEIGPRPFVDIRYLIERQGDQLSWNTVVSRARQWKCERAVWLTLSVVQRQLGGRIPKEVLEQLHHGGALSFLTATENAVVSCTAQDHSGESASRVLTQPGLRAKVEHLRNRLWLTPSERMFVYPDLARDGRTRGLAFVLRRSWDLLKRHAGRLLWLATRRDSPERRYVERRAALAAWLRDAPPT